MPFKLGRELVVAKLSLYLLLGGTEHPLFQQGEVGGGKTPCRLSWHFS